MGNHSAPLSGKECCCHSLSPVASLRSRYLENAPAFDWQQSADHAFLNNRKALCSDSFCRVSMAIDDAMPVVAHLGCTSLRRVWLALVWCKAKCIQLHLCKFCNQAGLEGQCNILKSTPHAECINAALQMCQSSSNHARTSRAGPGVAWFYAKSWAIVLT